MTTQPQTRSSPKNDLGIENHLPRWYGTVRSLFWYGDAQSVRIPKVRRIVGLPLASEAAVDDGDQLDPVARCAPPAIFARIEFSAEPAGGIANHAKVHGDAVCYALVAETLAGRLAQPLLHNARDGRFHRQRFPFFPRANTPSRADGSGQADGAPLSGKRDRRG